ncbi:alpha-(1,3)-fucosyltransferase fut-5-like [Exaiptasia diaphana]|uniref:Fucosyltransferase n=1 Tax=Exaiptasia diaphana TaxID=2652724 RepID=A0A913YB12_EXADI|nr:alpha-(1,3)-fucosyltransferase fut-5-like [Exaiptasia diaphana]
MTKPKTIRENGFLLDFQEDIQNLYHHFRYHAHCKVYPTRPLITDKQRFKRVLFYTPYFDNDIWPRAKLGSSWNLTREDGKACAHTCVISYNKCDLPFSDAVIFHEADLFRAHVLKSISIYRNPQQRWVYFTHENPQNANHDPSQYNGIFNWTVTYRRDSDVFYPDGYYREILSPDEIPKNHVTTNYAEPKDKLIVWAASHCGLLRDDVVHKIAHFLPLTVIGRCAKLFNQKTPNFCKRGSNDCSSFLRRFKFYLAFENAMCTDYITEKYWETPFDNNMVPIVLGSNYDFKVAIPGSYINILDFQNIEALVKYIEYLDRNDTAYNEYFQWKTKYTRIEPGEKSWTCQLCANIYNDSLPKKVYTNLGTYWGIDSNCNRSLESMIRSIIRE